MRYKVSQELNSKPRIIPDIDFFLKDLIFIVVWLAIAYVLRNKVSSGFHVLYWLFNICMAITMSLPSKTNPGRRNYQAMVIFLKRCRKSYKPVPLT